MHISKLFTFLVTVQFLKGLCNGATFYFNWIFVWSFWSGSTNHKREIIHHDHVFPIHSEISGQRQKGMPSNYHCNIVWTSFTGNQRLGVMISTLRNQNIKKILWINCCLCTVRKYWYSSFDEVTVLETHVVYYFDVLEIWIFLAHDPTEKKTKEKWKSFERWLKLFLHFTSSGFCIHTRYTYIFLGKRRKRKKEIFYINTKHLNRRKLN